MALLNVYTDAGQRVLGDCDILVPPDRVCEAAAILLEQGWIFHWNVSPACFASEIVPNYHSFGMRRGDIELDLHWHGLHQDLSPLSDVLTFANATDYSLIGHRMRRPCLTDLFFHAVLHGVRGQTDQLVWIMDVARILQYEPQYEDESLDWDYLLFRIKQSYVEETFARIWPLLRNEFGLAINRKLLSKLHPVRFRRFQQQELASVSPLFTDASLQSQFAVETMNEVRRVRPSRWRPWLRLVATRLRTVLATPGDCNVLMDLCLKPVRRRIGIKTIIEQGLPGLLYKTRHTIFPCFKLQANCQYTFGQTGNGTAMTCAGWSNPEADFIWSYNSQPVLQMLLPDHRAYTLEFDIQVYVPPDSSSTIIHAVVNHRTQQSYQATASNRCIKMKLMASGVRPDNNIDVRFDIFCPTSPIDHGGLDTRALGLCVRGLQVSIADDGL